MPELSPATEDHAIDMRGITKYFAETHVLADDDVSLTVKSGEVHALVGENGAGKTTLMNILFGLQQPDAGEIHVFGNLARIRSAEDALALGIGMVHQHFKLIDSFTVAQNVLLGSEPTRAGWLRPDAEQRIVSALSDEFGLPIDPNARVSDLPVGLQQRLEILKALHHDARVLILDEPTAVLTPQEARSLLDVLRGLAARGRSVILITHKLLEVIDSADRISVMRQGRLITTVPASSVTASELAELMVGRSVALSFERRPGAAADEVLHVEELTVVAPDGTVQVDDVSLTVHHGEVVGIAGVSGNGQDALVDAITGLAHPESGSVRLEGRDVTDRPVHERRAAGMAHIPEDRLTVGLNRGTTLDENVLVSHYRERGFARRGVLRMGPIRRLAEWVRDTFAIAAAQPGEGIATLSGGNLQKIVLGRELFGSPSCIIANQPTRGLDVGSIEFVHRTLLDARDNGAAVLLVSAEIDEVRALSDRIVVLYRGRIAGELTPDEATDDLLGLLMAGGARAEETPS